MKWFSLITLTTGAMLSLAGGVAWGGQRAVEDWVATYDSNSDYATAIALDDFDNIYVTGLSWGPSGSSCATIKYDSNSNEEWTAWYDGAGGETVAMAVDGFGNVYIACAVLEDYLTIKYNVNGIKMWEARYNGPSDKLDEPADVVVDDFGNVYVTGRSWRDESKFDYATVKYASDSNELVWVARYNGPGNDWDTAHAITVDSAGNIYVTGRSKGSGTGGSDYATIKYAPDSNVPVWVARYNGAANSYDEAYAIAVDDLCNICVTGSSEGSGTYSDCVTIKYGSDSNEPIWIARYDSPTNYFDMASDITIDGLGNVFVTGSTVSGVGADYDYITIKYGSDSNEAVWVEEYNSSGNDYDQAVAIAVDGSGNVYVTGRSEGDGTDYDYATIKYDTNGTELWEARYNGPGSGFDIPTGIAVDDSGNVYVAGLSMGDGTDEDYVTIKYAQCIQMGDIDCDKDVDFRDFALLGEYWLESGCGECGWADLDDDEDVDCNDLKKLAENWLEGKV